MEKCDSKKDNPDAPIPNISGMGATLYDLIIYWSKRKNAFKAITIFIITLLLCIFIFSWGIYKIIKPTVEVVGNGSGWLIKPTIFSDSTYHFLIHPRGPQNTGIIVEGGEKFVLSASGQVNIGPDLKALIHNTEEALIFKDHLQISWRKLGIIST
jgi:hypothetical protein